MKKTRKVLAFVFVMVLVFHSMVVSFSAQSSVASPGSLYIYSDPCPAEVLAFAISTYSSYAQNYIDGNGLEEIQVVSLGSPFTVDNTNNLSQVYHFPIFSGDEVIATFCVYIDFLQTEGNGKTVYTGVVSSFMVEELNSLLNKRQSSDFLFAYDENNQVEMQTVVETHGVRTAISEYEEVRTFVNIAAKLAQFVPRGSEDVSEMRSATPPRKFLMLNLNEGPQSFDNWCAAYCCAAIFRFLRGNTSTPTALSIMQIFDETPSILDSLTSEDVRTAANYYGYTPVYSTTSLAQTTIVSEIVNNSPIFVGMNVTFGSNTMEVLHAMVLRGYDTSLGMYSFWNPWYLSYITMQTSTMQIYDANQNCTFTWDDTFYSW